MEIDNEIQSLEIRDNKDVAMVTEETDKLSENPSHSEFDDGIFKVSMGAQTGSGDDGNQDTVAMETELNLFTPRARMGSLLVVKNNVLYMYGGMWEAGDKQFTFGDFYSLDLNKLEEWNTIIPLDEKNMVCTCIWNTVYGSLKARHTHVFILI